MKGAGLDESCLAMRAAESRLSQDLLQTDCAHKLNAGFESCRGKAATDDPASSMMADTRPWMEP